MAERVPVRVRDCTCPGSPHGEGDVVYLRPTIGLTDGLAAEQLLRDAVTAVGSLSAEVVKRSEAKPPDPQALAAVLEYQANVLRILTPQWWPIFVRQAIDWNLLDEDGRPVPFDLDAILDDYAIARPVADAADTLYQPAIIAPLVTPPPTHSRNGRTAGGTPQPTEPTPLRRRSSSARASDGQRSAASR